VYHMLRCCVVKSVRSSVLCSLHSQLCSGASIVLLLYNHVETCWVIVWSGQLLSVQRSRRVLLVCVRTDQRVVLSTDPMPVYLCTRDVRVSCSSHLVADQQHPLQCVVQQSSARKQA
jgi:hypothetical protein